MADKMVLYKRDFQNDYSYNKKKTIVKIQVWATKLMFLLT